MGQIFGKGTLSDSRNLNGSKPRSLRVLHVSVGEEEHRATREVGEEAVPDSDRQQSNPGFQMPAY